MPESTSTKEYPVVYVQSSNPSPELLAWIKDMSEDHVVYLQSGTPPPPPGGPPTK